MTKIDIFSGFLGAGKTTLIKKLIREAYAGEKLVLVENEFGEIGIDGGFMREAGIEITEMNSGCICCSLTGDFREALRKVKSEFAPDRILIEPSGVGKLSDVITAVEKAGDPELVVNSLVTVVDASKAKMYMKNFGEFYNNQIESAGCIVLSRTAGMSEEKLLKTVELIRGHNRSAVIITTPWEQLGGAQILSAIEQRDTLAAAMEALAAAHAEDDEDECDDPACSCHHHHHDGDHEHHHHHGEDDEHEHHHDEDDEHHHHHDEEHEHYHHHDGDGECDDPTCGCHHHHDGEHEHHHHHHGHDADEVFTSWGTETAKLFTEDELREKLTALDNTGVYGTVLRAKGIVASGEAEWFHFDYTPGEFEIRRGGAGVTGRLCVIGSGLNESAVEALFR